MGQDTPEEAISTMPRENGNFFQYAWDFNKHFWKDSVFQSRWNAVSRGFIFIVQAAGLVLTLSTAPLIIQALSVAGGAALAAIGGLAVVYGTAKSWASLEELCEKTHPTFNPLRKIRENMIEKPLMQKIMEKRPMKNRRLLSHTKQEVFLAGVTLEGSIAAGAYLAIHTAQHIAGLAALTPASVLTVGTVWASAVVAWCAYDAVCCVKTLAHIHSKHKQEKKAAKAAEKAPAPQTTVTASQEAKTDFSVKATPAFNTEAAVRQEAEQIAAQAKKAAAPTQKRRQP